MQFLTSLIGGSGSMYLNAALALGLVLALIVLALWGLKLVMRASSNAVRGSKKRLAVIDTLPVDTKRQLLIIRRDNVEHLILTGGPQDVVIESGIPVEQPAIARPMPRVTRAAPQAPLRPPLPARPAVSEPPSLPVANDEMPVPTASPLDRLREIGRTTDRRGPSLRQTGLLRPMNRIEPTPPANADNSSPPPSDSATTARVMPFGAPRDGNGQGFGGDGNSGGQRDDGY
ncbi:MAG TPA: hypothetical protein VL418_08680 [Devosiaceae bacterium]|nr:hypothetical protein [Devosiaceae bacterium]